MDKSADDIKVEDVEEVSSRNSFSPIISSDSWVSKQKLSIVGMNATIESASVVSASQSQSTDLR
jgi:hypothetical protein